MKVWAFLRWLAARFATPVALIAACATAGAQTLDQKAWNAVYDRLANRLKNQNDYETVHVLDEFVAATWVKGTEASSLELLNLAGALPEPVFSVVPSVMKERLHDVYLRAVLDVDLPLQDEAKSKAYRAARTEFGTAYDALQARKRSYDDLWDKHAERLRARNEKVNSRAYLKFLEQNKGYFTQTRGDMEDAVKKLQQFAPVSEVWASAVTNLRLLYTDMQVVTPGLFRYEGDHETLESLKECEDGKPDGWETIVFGSSVDSTQNRTSKWNASGGWGGSFFKLNAGGGGGSYQSTISKATESVTLRFCNMRRIALSPGAWFVPSLFRAIHEGDLKLKDDSKLKRAKLLGPDGMVQRVVKGAIVARSVQFIAKLDESKLTEMRSHAGRSGRIGIGPFGARAGKGRTDFSRELRTAKGEYGLSTSSDVPIVLAIITEEVK